MQGEKRVQHSMLNTLTIAKGQGPREVKVFGMFKIVGVSAALAAAVVAIANEPQRAEAAPIPTAALEQMSSAEPKVEPQPKVSQDEVKPNPCAGLTWPYVSADCMTPQPVRPARKVRVITAETSLITVPTRR
jgi:hypothetical protein